MQELDPCTVPGCAFFANRGCESRCSAHARQKVVNLLFMMPLPSETLEMVWRASGHEKQRTLTDDEIVQRLGVRAEDVLVSSELVTEKLQQIREFQGCFDTILTRDVFDDHKKLRKEDAERLMVAVHLRFGGGGHVQTQRAIVRRTFHRGALSQDLFSIGLCYEGTPVCHSKMTREQLRGIIFAPLCTAEGGGGGGGVGGVF